MPQKNIDSKTCYYASNINNYMKLGFPSFFAISYFLVTASPLYGVEKRESERKLEKNIENLVMGGMGLNDFLFILGFATALSSFGLNAVLRSGE